MLSNVQNWCTNIFQKGFHIWQSNLKFVFLSFPVSFFVMLAVFACGIFCIIENHQYKIPFEALHMKTKLILKSKARHENYFSFDVYKIIAHIVYLVRLLDVCTVVGVRLDYIYI